MKKFVWIMIIIAVVWTGFAYFNHSSKKTAKELPRVGFQAPRFTLKSLKGKAYSMQETKGKPIVLNFWASWCGPCKKETPELVKLYKQYEGEFQLYGINLTSLDTLGAAKAFVRDFKMNYPVLLDKNGTVKDKYKITGYPTTYLMNGEGIIVKKIRGYTGEGVLTKEIKSLISN